MSVMAEIAVAVMVTVDSQMSAARQIERKRKWNPTNDRGGLFILHVSSVLVNKIFIQIFAYINVQLFDSVLVQLEINTCLSDKQWDFWHLIVMAFETKVLAHFPSLKLSACDMGNPSKAGICKQVEGGQAIILYTSLYLMALGVGGIKGSLPVHVVEQFDENDGKERKLRSNFFN
ncbi:hypothetical protein SUGI_1131400 [Cryptomeria japonica]|nr:hypothetical protein SUGI_1131400 [Cryptomeria japonica]